MSAKTKQLLTDRTSYKVSNSDDDDFTPPLGNLLKASILIMSVCFAMLPAPQDSWAGAVHIYASNKLSVAPEQAGGGCVQTASWEWSLECWTCQTGPRNPLGAVLAGMAEGHMPASIYRIDSSAIMPLPEHCLI